VPQYQNPLDADTDASSDADVGEKCAICLDVLTKDSATTLPCSHAFHDTCVSELRKLGVKQACPLCRNSLSTGPENIHEESTRRFMVVNRVVERGFATWNNLPASARQELDAAMKGWQSAADEGFAPAQHVLAVMLSVGRGVATNSAEAERWFRIAADQDYTPALVHLGELYEKGLVLAQNFDKAIELFKKGADQGGQERANESWDDV